MNRRHIGWHWAGELTHYQAVGDRHPPGHLLHEDCNARRGPLDTEAGGSLLRRVGGNWMERVELGRSAARAFNMAELVANQHLQSPKCLIVCKSIARLDACFSMRDARIAHLD